MAIAHITFRDAVDMGGSSIMSRTPSQAATITTSGTSQATSIAALGGEVGVITVSGGAVFVAVGAAPVAASGSGDLVPDGGAIFIGRLLPGDKVAVINAS